METTDPKPTPPWGGDPRPPASKRRWTVLFIGDHGQVIAFKRVKTLIALALGVLATALAAVAVLLVVNQGLHGRTRDLQERLQAARRELDSLGRERDLLTAHVVLVETKMKETLSGVGRAAGERKGAPAEAEKPTAPAAARAEDAEGTSAAVAAGVEVRAPIFSGETVAVEGFAAALNPARQAIDIKYRLVAAGAGPKPAAGHVIVVFKSDQLEPEAWLAMPRVELPKGRPSGAQKGYSFSIHHSKAFAQSLPVPKNTPGFTAAVFYVFSNEGQLMLAREYAVKIQPSGG
jgi:hypothetical protein